jgi:hypothetical protein
MFLFLLQLVSMANYLRSWGLAEVIPVIYSRSCYRVHNKTVLHRDSRVGRAFEALLLSLSIPLTETPTCDSRSRSGSRPNSAPFLIEDGLLYTGGAPNGASTISTSASLAMAHPAGAEPHNAAPGNPPSLSARRRANSVATPESSYDNTNTRGTLQHHMGRQQHHSSFASHASTGTPVPSSAGGATAAGGHYMVSPAISKYRQRREGFQRDDSYLTGAYGSLRNSRSSEGLLKSLAHVAQGAVAGVLRRDIPGYHSRNDIHTPLSEPSSVPAVAPTLARSVTTLVPTAPKVPLLTTSTSDGDAPVPAGTGAETSTVKTTSSAVPTARGVMRGHSTNTATAGIHAVLSAVFFGQNLTHAGIAQPSASAQAPESSFRDIASAKAAQDTNTSERLSSRPLPPPPTSVRSKTGPAEPRAGPVPIAASRDEWSQPSHSGANNTTNEVVLSASYPPSALNSSNLSNANREMGFQHVVDLAEVGGMHVPPSRSPLPTSGEDNLFSTLGNNNSHSKSPFADETPGYAAEDTMPVVVHSLDVADNIPPQYSLPVVLSAFDGCRVLQEVIDRLPGPLRDYSVEIVVFLLR